MLSRSSCCGLGKLRLLLCLQNLVFEGYGEGCSVVYSVGVEHCGVIIVSARYTVLYGVSKK